MTWQERLVTEHQELQARLIKLNDFLRDPPTSMDPHDLFLLRRQRDAMIGYKEVLDERVRRIMC